MLPFFYVFLLSASTVMLADGRCGHPGIPKYGGLTTASKKYYNEGELVSYACNPPFVLYGSDTRKCQRNGSWSEEVPFCLRRAGGIQSGSRLPLALLDGNLTTCASFLNVILFGKITVSPSERPNLIALKIVHGNGRVFMSPFIDCKGRAQTIAFHHVLVYGNEEIQLRVCEPQYAVNLMYYIICEIEILQFKGPKDCGTPDSPANAEKAVLSEMAGQVISKTTCFQDRFILVGNGTRVCDDFGKWSEELQYCKAMYCEDLKQAEKHSELKLSYEPPLSTNVFPPISTRARYSCSEGFVLNGESERKCLSNGTWSVNKPLCIPDVSYCRTWKVVGVAGICTIGFILLAFIGYFILLFCRKHSKTSKQSIPPSPASRLNPNNASFTTMKRETRINPTFSSQSYCYISRPSGNYSSLYDDAESTLPHDSTVQSVVAGFDSSRVTSASEIVIDCCGKSQMYLQPISSRKPEDKSCPYTPEQLYVEIID